MLHPDKPLTAVGFWRPTPEQAASTDLMDGLLAFIGHAIAAQPRLPRVQDHCNPLWRAGDPAAFVAVLTYVRHPDRAVGYMGWSDCRICGVRNGDQDFFRGDFVFPSGYGHYIAQHDVQPPAALIAAALAAAGAPR